MLGILDNELVFVTYSLPALTRFTYCSGPLAPDAQQFARIQSQGTKSREIVEQVP